MIGLPIPHDLRLVFWETTAGCNLECSHCRRLDVSRQLMRDDLTTTEAQRMIAAIARAALRARRGRPILVFSGGEPLLRPDLFELAEHAESQGLPTALATNGTLIDETVAPRIMQAGFERVAISLDGPDAATHDAFRQQDGAFAAAVAGFQRLAALGMSMQINCTVTKHNAHRLDELYALARRLAADALHFFMFVPVGCGLEITEEQRLVAEEYERVLTWIAQQAAKQELIVRATCAPQYFRLLAQRRQRPSASSKFASMTRGCLAGTHICFISHKGEVMPCGYLPLLAGNIREETFEEVWQRSHLFHELREPDLLGGKCGACEYRRICGGCRARAFAGTGDYLSEEPCCAYVPNVRRPAIA
ncbi:MAG: radical SAM protein [Candidatus Omnitrophica bacterium]|nr:radical SAM protein [Candidatus Omnitrophota bacterium]